MKTMPSYVWILACSVLLQAGGSCSKKSTPPAPAPPPPADTVTTRPSLIDLPSGWQKAASYMTGFPAGIEVYRNSSLFNGKPMNAFCVVFDPGNAALEFKPVLATANKRPSVFFNEESGTTYACINGGFFGTNASYSLVQYDGAISSVNIRSLSRTYNGTATTYYPTRGAFGIDGGGKPGVAWIYHTGTGTGTVYSYPAPSPNALNSAPQPQPTASFPAGGAPWTMKSAIGGSPVLIRNNSITITDTEELIDINNTTARARSAIGATAGGKVILLAVEGNNPAGGAGLNLEELATLLKSMGCVQALNLDGGGSTALVVNGQQTVKPSDSGGERAVMSVVLVKKK